jgi:hypothetical protein
MGFIIYVRVENRITKQIIAHKPRLGGEREILGGPLKRYHEITTGHVAPNTWR